MNKKILSTSFSLACHTLFLIAAFNMVFAPPSVSAPVEPPVLIHVHLEPRPFSPSLGVPKPPLTSHKHPTPKVRMTRKHHLKKQQPKPHPLPMVKSAPKAAHKPVVTPTRVISIVKRKAPRQVAPREKNVSKTLVDAKDMFKNMAVSNRQMPNSDIMPASEVSTQIEEMQMQPSIESEMENVQGATPYLPSDDNGKAQDIKAFMGYDLYVYEDPDDHAKYFKLSIKVEDIPGSLVPLHKEITFLVDGSASIGPMLAQFKEGVEDALQQLNPGDKFNIAVFNSAVNRFQNGPVDNTIGNVHQAKEFLDGFNAGSTTDLYNTVLNNLDSRVMKPSYVVLISDGQPTQGVVDSLQLINKIGQANHGQTPIFALGAGADYNQYLMNFLAFTNHGWAEFADINAVTGITDLYSHIKNPVLTDLRYYSVGLDKKEIYPKLLPDLFKGSDFVLYGRVTNEDSFLFQLRGNSANDVKQYVIKDNISNGQQGDRSIAQEWAIRKVYDLIGKLQYDQNNQAIIDQINRLASKFDLKIPQYNTKE